MTAQWYVLIEEDTRETRRADGVELRLHHWTLVASHPVTADQDEVRAVAEDAALHYVPGVLARHARPGDVPGRSAFLASDGSWLVRVHQNHRACHFRVTTARLVHARPEEQASPKSLKEKLRHALDGPEPLPAPWAPPPPKG
ncbi:hypothetical protein [Streptomyces sp. NBC_00102]|uniref:hypothetical protein n=1 Tax=Streptomyces sp. NBC_00102 TaxID=2975652 RepID=UPI002256A638|nr:hypothetical protein [Streptomyces sp. NBC_00102]MCX5396860.1 hypothetical protein [Streptomyces sp. NBC_00102]